MLQLALPVVLSYLGIMLMPLVDLLAVGRVSAAAVGAVGIGTSVFTWLMIFGIGLLSGLDYLISYSVGAGKNADARAAYAQGVWISLILGVPGSAVLFAFSYQMSWLGITGEVLPLAASYVRILSFSLAPVMVFTATRNYLQGRHIAQPVLWILILANIVNAALNYAFVLGHWGFQVMGSDGSAWATFIARYWMMIAIVGYAEWIDRRESIHSRWSWHPEIMRSLMKLGIPAALHMTFEVGVFAVSTLLAGGLAPTALAAHQIVLNTASMTFMVPLGLSAATAVLVGQAGGRGDHRQARRLGWQGLGLGVGFMTFSALMLWTFSSTILRGYTHDAAILQVAPQILLIAALFQISDGAQVVAAGALRGLGDTKSAAIANLAGHWGLGLPGGVLLCYQLGRGLQGLWMGLSLGLTCVAITLLWRWTHLSKARLARAHEAS